MVAILRLAMALTVLVFLACSRPDGSENPQVLSSSLITPPTVAATLVPLAVPLPTVPVTTSSTVSSAPVSPDLENPPNTVEALESPTALETPSPSPLPTPVPTAPTAPTPEPAAIPTQSPTPIPTVAPTEVPTEIPEPTQVPTPTPDPVIVQGRQLFTAFGCSACHAITELGLTTAPNGPSLDDLRLRSGTQVPGLQPREYIRESLIDPQVFLSGEFSAVMPALPDFVAPEAVDSLIEFLFSLGEGEPEIAEAPPLVIPDEAIVFDSLTGSGDLDQRTPNVAGEGVTWIVESGLWGIAGRGATETTGAAADHRATVDAGISDVELTVELRYLDGVAGIVYRYRDPLNWNMLWYDGSNQNFLFGTRVDGVFAEIPREPFEWGTPVAPRLLKVRVVGETLIVTVDGDEIAIREIAADEESTAFGIFSHSSAKNRFSNFQITEPGLDLTSE